MFKVKYIFICFAFILVLGISFSKIFIHEGCACVPPVENIDKNSITRTNIQLVHSTERVATNEEIGMIIDWLKDMKNSKRKNEDPSQFLVKPPDAKVSFELNSGKWLEILLYEDDLIIKKSDSAFWVQQHDLVNYLKNR